MSKPVICFDFDGTLVNAQGHIHPRDVEILRTENRVIFVPATGRPLHAVKHAFERNGLFANKPIPFPMVLQNGAIVYLPNEILFRQTPLDSNEQTELLATGRRYSQMCCLLFSLNRVQVMYPNPFSQKMLHRFDLNIQPFNKEENIRYTKLIYIADSADMMNAFLADIESISVEKLFSLPTVLELTKTGINKGQMLLDLLKNMGQQTPQIIAAGDGENDLPLFDVADVSFCPTDSPVAIKNRADREIDTIKTGLLSPMLTALELT